MADFRRAEHNDHRQAGSHVGVCGAFRHVLIIYQHGKHGVTLPQKHRSAEVRQAGASHESHVAGADDTEVHRSLLLARRAW